MGLGLRLGLLSGAGCTIVYSNMNQSLAPPLFNGVAWF